MVISLLERSSSVSLGVTAYDISLQLPIILQQSWTSQSHRGETATTENWQFFYCLTTHATTGHTPAMLFMGWDLRSHLDLLKPDIRKDVQDKQSSMVEATRNKTRFFNVGQRVLARDYRDPSQKWHSGTIRSRTGPLIYTINVGANLVWRRHVDQILDAECHVVPEQPERTHLHLKIQKSLPSLHHLRFRVYVKPPMFKHLNFPHRALWTLTKQADVTLREIAEHLRDWTYRFPVHFVRKAVKMFKRKQPTSML